MDERKRSCSDVTYWESSGAEIPEIPSLVEYQKSADYVIVGAGYTGLSAALILAESEPHARIMVFEASDLCKGASSRNGGMVGAHPRLTLHELEQHFGREVGICIYKEADRALEYLQSLIMRHKIACDFEICGRIQCAWTKAALKRQEMMCYDISQHTSQNVEMLDKASLNKFIDNRAYFGGLYFHDHGAFHPQKFHVGLVKAVLKAGVIIVPNCAIKRLLPKGAGFEIQTSKNVISCKNILVATNGYTQGKGVLQDFSARIFPVPSYVIATEPLDSDRIARLISGRSTMVETHPRHAYWRISPDGTCIILGARASLGQISSKRAGQRLRKILAKIWPDLKNIGISYAWKGNTGFSFTSIPWVGRYKGVYFAGGYSGGGTALAPYLGMKAAKMMLGQAGSKTAYSATNLTTKPWYWGGYPWFLGAANIWYMTYVDAYANWTAKRDRQAQDM